MTRSKKSDRYSYQKLEGNYLRNNLENKRDTFFAYCVWEVAFNL